jgi:hypothetical protein
MRGVDDVEAAALVHDVRLLRGRWFPDRIQVQWK